MSSKRRINPLSKSRREWLFKRQSGKCCWCGKGMVLGGSGKHAVTDEHLVTQQASRRKKRRGQDTDDDARFMLLACFKCNTGRRSEAPQETLELAARYHAEYVSSTVNSNESTDT
jgi:hypothetical protein